MTLEHQDDAVQHALDRLPGLFQGLPGWQKLITAFVGECQELENALYDLIVDGFLGNARGAHLDQYGELVNEERGGLGDPEYRNLIRARIRANRSNGAPEELIAIARLLGGSPVALFEHFPATVSVESVLEGVVLDSLPNGRRARILEAAKNGGVFLRVVEAPSDYFGFAADPNARGFGVGRFTMRTDADG